MMSIIYLNIHAFEVIGDGSSTSILRVVVTPLMVIFEISLWMSVAGKIDLNTYFDFVTYTDMVVGYLMVRLI